MSGMLANSYQPYTAAFATDTLVLLVVLFFLLAADLHYHLLDAHKPLHVPIIVSEDAEEL